MTRSATIARTLALLALVAVASSCRAVSDTVRGDFELRILAAPATDLQGLFVIAAQEDVFGDAWQSSAEIDAFVTSDGKIRNYLYFAEFSDVQPESIGGQPGWQWMGQPIDRSSPPFVRKVELAPDQPRLELHLKRGPLRKQLPDACLLVAALFSDGYQAVKVDHADMEANDWVAIPVLADELGSRTTDKSAQSGPQ